ncbi:MAG: sialidase, partial [Acidobacteria bacterium]
DRHTFGDMNPYVYKTTDFGKTWTRIAGPEQGLRGYAHVVKEDTVNPDLLFVGTEFGLWISNNGGKDWAQFKGGNFPNVAVRDMVVNPRNNDLVLATHGRGIWIIDDITPLRQLTDEVLQKEATFVEARPAVQRLEGQGGWVQGDALYVGDNPPEGAAITYYQRTRHLFGPIKLEILNADGRVVDTLPASKRRGLNRVMWSMRLGPPRVPRAAQLAGNSQQGPRVLPGTYTVRLTKGKEVYETKLTVGLDQRATFSAADRKLQFDAAMRVHKLFDDMSTLVDKINKDRAAANTLVETLPADDQVRKDLESFSAEAEKIRKKIVATKEGGAITGEERLREFTDQLYGAIMSYEGKPTAYQMERIDSLQRMLDDVTKDFQSFTTQQVPKLNQELKAKNLESIPE